MKRGVAIKLIGVGLLAVLLWKADLGALARTLASCRWELLIAAGAVAVLVVWMKGLRWHLMLTAQGLRYRVTRSVRVYFIGLYLGLATPGKLGELARLTYLRRDLDASAGLGLSSLLVDRVFDLYALLVVGLLACFRFHLAGGLSGLFLAFVVALAAFPLVLLNPRLLRRFSRGPLARLARRFAGDTVSGELDAFSNGIEQMLPRRLLASVLLTLAAQLLIFFSGFLLTRSLRIDIGFIDAALVLGAANLSALVPITFAGIGTRDAVFVLAFGYLGLERSQALAFSALILGVFYVGLGLVGLAALLGERTRPIQGGRPAGACR